MSSNGGRIDRLVVENFKSWGETQEIGPFKTFTAVIGPNGSGKSNVMDAISFVVGVKTQTLRGNQIKDLIHVKGHDDKVQRSAYVELVYVKDNGDEMRFRRSIPATADKTTYSIDGRIITWAKYVEKLKDINILVKAQNFLVFQGDVVQIASKNPKELTEMIEQISGSADLREKYELLKEQAQEAEQEALQLFDKKRTTEKERKLIKDQKDEAEEFESRLQDQREAKTKLYLLLLLQLRNERVKNHQELQQLNDELQKQRKEFAALEEETRKTGESNAQLRKKILEQEKDFAAEQRALEKKRPKQIKTQEELEFAKQKLAKLNAEVEKKSKEYAAQQKEIASLEASLKGVRARSAALDSEEEEPEIKLHADQLKEYMQLKEKAGAQGIVQRQQLEKVRRDLRSDTETVTNVESHVQTLSTRRQQVQDTMADLGKRKDKMEAILSETEAQLADIKSKLGETQEKLANAGPLREAKTRELQSVLSQLSERSAEARQSEAEQRMASAITSMKSHYPGVYGRLFDLCKPNQQRFNLAVTIAMGKHMDSIVVQDEKTAIDCVNYLRETKAGTATFIPLDSARVVEVPDSYRRLGGSKIPVFDIIDINEKFKVALQFAVGNTLLCDTLAEARELCFSSASGDLDEEGKRKYKVVTVDGEIIHKTGNMTGGHGKQHSKASKWDEKKDASARARKDELLKELSELDNVQLESETRFQLMQQMEHAKMRVKYTRADLESTTKKLAKSEEELKHIEKELAAKENELITLKASQQEKQKEVSALEAEIHQVEAKIFQAFSKKVGVANIHEYEEKRMSQAQQLMNQRLQLADEQSRLTNVLEYEKKRDLKSALDDATSRKTEQEELIAQLKKEEAALKKALEKDRVDTEKRQAEIQKMKQQLDEQHKKYLTSKAAATSHQRELQELEKVLQNRTDEQEKADDRRAELLRRSKLEQIALPVTVGGIKRRKVNRTPKKGKKGVAAAAMDDDEPPEADDVDEVDGGEIDYTSITDSDDFDISTPAKFAAAKKQYEETVSELAAAIEKLNPNLKAKSQFEDIQGKLSTTSSELNSKQSRSKELAAQFEEVRAERSKRFTEAFDHVSERIEDIYQALTKSDAFPMGGKAYLAKQDNNTDAFLAGIQYTAMPPMKRFRNMESLSGGEKTVAALALLFAIHSYHPAPFFVLDEVDDALDVHNIGRVSSYIRTRSRNDGLQCIVISLKEAFYSKADALVGIYRNVAKKQSGSLTLDLTAYMPGADQM